MKIIKYILLLLNLLGFAIFFDSRIFSMLGNISWILLIIIVYSRPLSNIFNKVTFLKKIVSIRKELGILCVTLGIAHVIGFFINAGGLSLFFDSFYWRLNNGFGYGIYALIISIPLLVTSNLAYMKFFGKYWKSIQRLTYIFFILVGIHVALIKGYFSIEPIIIVFIWIVIWFIAYFKTKLPTN